MILQTIVVLSVLKIVKENIVKYKKGNGVFGKLLSNWGGQDRIFRIILSLFLLLSCLISYLDTDNQSLQTKLKVEKILTAINFLTYLRRITRIPRSVRLYQNVRSKFVNILLDKSKKQNFIEDFLQVIGEGLNAVYFFCDHYILLCYIGFFDAWNYLNETIFYFNLIWLLSSIFLFLKDITKFINLPQRQKKYQKDLQKQQKNKEYKRWLLYDTIKNFFDIICNYESIYPNTFSKPGIGFCVMGESLLWIIDFLLTSN